MQKVQVKPIKYVILVDSVPDHVVGKSLTTVVKSLTLVANIEEKTDLEAGIAEKNLTTIVTIDGTTGDTMTEDVHVIVVKSVQRHRNPSTARKQ